VCRLHANVLLTFCLFIEAGKIVSPNVAQEEELFFIFITFYTMHGFGGNGIAFGIFLPIYLNRQNQ
jgi:hypothetical protein